MNYKLLPAAIAAATVMASSANAGDIVTYGKINLSYVQDEQDQAGTIENDNWELKTAASRIGFKGSEQLSEDLKVIYKLEYEVQPDGDDNSNEFKGRNSYVGLQGGFGTIIAGEHDTPLKMSSKPVDVFNDYHYADIAYSITGERRESDIIMYKTPALGAYAATIAVMPGDDSGKDGEDDNDGFADQISAAVTYQGDNLYVALAGDQDVGGDDTVRLSTSYKLDNLKLGALIQKSDLSDTADSAKPNLKKSSPLYHLSLFANDIDEQFSRVISAAYTIDQWVLKAQFVEATNKGTTNEVDSSAMSVGVDYKLSKRTKLYSYYSELTVDSNDSIGLNEDYEYTAIGLIGIEHKF